MPTRLPDSLGIDQARKLVIQSQRLFAPTRTGRAIDVTRDVVRRIGYVQIDTISVIERAHHHTLWNRNPRYRHDHLDRLVAEGGVFEYWAHAASYLPMEDYRFALPRMMAERQGSGRWHSKNAALMRQVMKRIEREGPLMSRDFEDPNPGKRAMWEWKPAKYALEQLFIEGRVMSIRREGFNKVYDLTERVLPADTDTTVPTTAEYARYLVSAFLRANGIGRVTEFVHLRKGMRQPVQAEIERMLRAGELASVAVRGEPWLLLPESLQLLEQPMRRQTAILLSPFDNLVIQRKRLKDLFDFDYQLECYVPDKKRIHGYFVLPVLWRGRLVARVDLKAHRPERRLELRYLLCEPGLRALDRFADSLATALEKFAAFNDCVQVSLGRLGDANMRALLKRRLG